MWAVQGVAEFQNITLKPQTETKRDTFPNQMCIGICYTNIAIKQSSNTQ